MMDATPFGFRWQSESWGYGWGGAEANATGVPAHDAGFFRGNRGLGRANAPGCGILPGPCTRERHSICKTGMDFLFRALGRLPKGGGPSAPACCPPQPLILKHPLSDHALSGALHSAAATPPPRPARRVRRGSCAPPGSRFLANGIRSGSARVACGTRR